MYKCNSSYQDPAQTVKKQDTGELLDPLCLDKVWLIFPVFLLHRKNSHIIGLAAED